jgi:predicted ArsR family transcriptional regulator
MGNYFRGWGMRGNPVKRRRGEAVRAVLMAVLKPNEPQPVEHVTQVCGVSRVVLLQHLATLQAQGKIRRYTTASMMVRVW